MALRPLPQRVPVFGLMTILALSGYSGSLLALTPAGSAAAPRIVDAVDENSLVTLPHQTHPLASPKFDRGAVEDSLPMEHMYLQLKRSAEQEAALEQQIQDLQDPHSGKYHQWLTAEQLGANYGPSQQDIDTVVSWLSSHGMTVNMVHKSGMVIDVSGTAGQINEAFHTQMHSYVVNGTSHVANASDPQIPAALAPVVAGFVSLNGFLPKPAVMKPKKQFTFPCTGCPDGFDGQTQYDESPADLAIIYNVAPLYTAKQPITGKGQTVVVLEETDVNPADVATFRKAFIPTRFTGTFAQIHPGTGCADPGLNGAEGEAALDAEWAGAVAADATVELASCADTLTNFGPFIAAQNLLDLPTPPPIMSLSYLGCEVDQGPGPSGNGFINALWQQAASEGVSVFVAAGDNGAAGCDDFDTAEWAISGVAANGLASTPYDVATGGTDFLDTYLGQNSTYWASSNIPIGLSAKSYIPEIPWNDSCGSNVLYTYAGYKDGLTFCNSTLGSGFLNIVAGSGAPSLIYPKPYWQTNVVGVPNDGKRDLPDVSLFASNGFWNHAILLCMSDAAQGGAPCDYTNAVDTFFNSAGGTSFTAPQFASIQALINQKAGAPQGNPDPIFYGLARSQFGTSSDPNETTLNSCNSTAGNKVGSSCVFQDVTLGTTTVPCFGPNGCYDPSFPNGFGLLSTSTTTLQQAYPTTTGWDFATGLGTVNVTNLVNSWP
ncbi:MAG: S53 family peptidase [Acidobacteriaceae bacterium]